MRVLLAIALLGCAGALRLGQLSSLRGPVTAEEVDSKNSAIGDRLAKEEFCAEKKCKDDSKFYCGKMCVEKEADCAAGTKEAALKEAASKTKCQDEKKVWCKGKCNAPKDCPDFSKVDCDNLATASATGATGATGKEEPKKEEKKKEAPTTTTEAPATTTTEMPQEDDEKKPVTMTACEMVKPWETNQYYLKHVLPGPPKTKSFCCLAMVRELANRVNALMEKLANCEPKDSEECQKLAAELSKMKALLKKQRDSAGITDKDMEKEKTAVDANAFDKHMTKDWTDKKIYKKFVEPHPDHATKNFTQVFTMSKDDEKKKFPLGSAIGRDQYAHDDNVTVAAMNKYRAKVGAKKVEDVKAEEEKAALKAQEDEENRRKEEKKKKKEREEEGEDVKAEDAKKKA